MLLIRPRTWIRQVFQSALIMLRVKGILTDPSQDDGGPWLAIDPDIWEQARWLRMFTATAPINHELGQDPTKVDLEMKDEDHEDWVVHYHNTVMRNHSLVQSLPTIVPTS